MEKINLSLFSAQFAAWKNCKESNNITWQEHWHDLIAAQLERLPSGGGLDAGVNFNWDKSKPEALVFNFWYHHMVEGSYTGWTQHRLKVTPSFQHGFTLTLTGPNKNGIYEYLYDLFHDVFEVGEKQVA